MEKRNKRKYSYTLALGTSLLIAAVLWVFNLAGSGDSLREAGLYFSGKADEAQSSAVSGTVPADRGAGKKEIGMSVEDSAVLSKESTDTVNEEESSGTADDDREGVPTESMDNMAADDMAETEEESEQTLEMYTADRTYFDDALFIGDSRTVGLYEYGDLGNAEVVADLGMSVYKIFSRKFRTASGEKKLLETVLTERQFGKIYLMMGVNELGYDHEHTVKKYRELLERLQDLQPDALIFIQANLHITEEKSASSSVYNNENINRFNLALEQLADGQKLFYLDANELFDDDTGSLSKECTTDDTHVLAQYYPDWVEWILQHAR